MKKRLFATLLAVVMVLSILPGFASAEPAAATPEISRVSMTLTGILGVNFLVDDNGADMSACSVRVTIGNDTTTQTISAYTMDGDLYAYTAKVPVHRVQEPMKVELLAGGTVVYTRNAWTASTYFDGLRRNHAEDEALVAVVDALENCATYAAYYAAPTGTAPAISAVTQVQPDDLTDYRPKVKVNSEAAAALAPAVSAELNEACDLKISFNAAAWTGNTLYVDGKACAVTTEGDKVSYTIPEILPQDFGILHTFLVKDAQNGKVFECGYGVLSYVYSLLHAETEAQTGLNDLLKAMYLYYCAVGNYVEIITPPAAFVANVTPTSAAKPYVTVTQDPQNATIRYEYAEGTTGNGSLAVATDFVAGSQGNFARNWDMSGTITKDTTRGTYAVLFGVKTADGKVQWFSYFEDGHTVGNPGEERVKMPNDNQNFWFNQATCSFYWGCFGPNEDAHNPNQLDYHLVIENDVLTGYFGNSSCTRGDCTMKKAWQIPLTDAKYGGFAPNSSYQICVNAMYPVSMTLSNISVETSGAGASLTSINARDPFILVDDDAYYIYCTGSTNGYIKVRSSTDLVTAHDLGKCFEVEVGDTFYPRAGGSIWAPEVFKYTYNGETAYYMFVTLERPDCVRGTAILKADSPTGPFEEFSTYDHGFITPAGHSCLDGTLYIENGVPYMIYAHEFSCSTCNDGMGDMCYIQLSPDLTHAVGTEQHLFRAEDLTDYSWWQTTFQGKKDSTITDGPFVFSKNGTNYLLWSTFVDDVYVEAYSTFGSILNGISGSSEILYADNGGHGMAFTDLDGQDKLVIHTPNSGATARPTLFDLTFEGTTMHITPNKPWDWNKFNRAKYRAEAYATYGKDGITTLFVGDSFFDPPGLWTTWETDLAYKEAMVLGNGGTTYEDWYNYLTREIFLNDIAPKNLVVNLGNNDIFIDLLTGEQLEANMARFFNAVHAEMPNTPIYAFSITDHTGAYTDADAQARLADANNRMEAWCADKDWITFVDLRGETIEFIDHVHPQDIYYSTVYLPKLAEAGCVMDEIPMVTTTLANSVNLGGYDLQSEMNKWDTSEIENGIVRATNGLGSSFAALYFDTAVSDFVAEAYFEYEAENGEFAQNDLQAGFTINDGSYKDWILALNTGVRANGWDGAHTFQNLIKAEDAFLLNPNRKPVKFSIARQGDTVSVYINDVFVKELAWADVAPHAAANGAEKVAVGLLMNTDNASTLKVSNYKLIVHPSFIDAYVEARADFGRVVEGSLSTRPGINWDLSEIGDGVIRGTKDANNEIRNDDLFFRQAITGDFAVEAYFEREAFSDQWDILAGFRFKSSTAVNNVWVDQDAIVYNGWSRKSGLLDHSVLMNNTRLPVKYGLVRRGETAYIYLDDALVWTVPWTTLVPNIGVNETIAVALSMYADNPATLKVSQYRLLPGTEGADQFIIENSGFASSLTVNGKPLASALDKWDVSQIREGTVSGSNALGTTFNPLFFKETASDFAVEAYFEYDPNGPADQPDMFAGFEFKDGNAGCWVMAHDTGITYSGWVFENGLYDTAVLKNDTKVPVKFAVVKIGGNAYLYVNDVLVKTTAWSTIAPWIPAENSMAIGLSMIADSPAKMNASQYNLYIGTAAAVNYNFDKSALARTVTVNTKTISSSMNNWDINEIGNGIIHGTKNASNDIRWKNLYFKETVTGDFVVEAKFEYVDLFGQWDMMGGFNFHNGTTDNRVWVDNKGLRYNGWTGNNQALLSEGVLLNGTRLPVKLGIVRKGETAYVYLNDTFVWEVAWNTLVPNISANAEMAVGFHLYGDNDFTGKISNFKLLSGTAAADEYMTARAVTPFAASPFATSLVVNGTTLTSAVNKWDLSELKNGIISGTKAANTKFNPLFFSQTASDFAVEAYFEYDSNHLAEQNDLFGGFEFKDGSNACWLMAHDTGITYTGWKFEYHLYNPAVLRSDTKLPVKFAIVKVGTTASIYVNDVLVKTCDWSLIAPTIPAENTMAIGLSMTTDNHAKINISQYNLYAGTEAANAYIAAHTAPQE